VAGRGCTADDLLAVLKEHNISVTGSTINSHPKGFREGRKRDKKWTRLSQALPRHRLPFNSPLEIILRQVKKVKWHRLHRACRTASLGVGSLNLVLPVALLLTAEILAIKGLKPATGAIATCGSCW
jgi:hypothetical protein